MKEEYVEKLIENEKEWRRFVVKKLGKLEDKQDKSDKRLYIIMILISGAVSELLPRILEKLL